MTHYPLELPKTRHLVFKEFRVNTNMELVKEVWTTLCLLVLTYLALRDETLIFGLGKQLCKKVKDMDQLSNFLRSFVDRGNQLR